MCRNPKENVTYEFVLASPALLCMSCSSYLNGLWDRRQVAIQLLFCGELLLRFVQDSTQHSSLLPILLFFMCFVSVLVVHPYSSMDTVTACKKSCFILLDRPELHIIDNLSIAFHTFTRHMLTSLSVNEILLPRYVNWSTNFRGLPLKR